MINQLIANIKKTGAPIVVGLDPMLKYIPEHIQKKAFAEFGETLEGAAEAIWQFNKEIVDKTYDLIPAVKPQIAMYEQFGIPGLVAFKKTVYDNMAFGLKLRKVPKDEIDKKVREAARILDLEKLLDRKPKALSGGQRQRVAMGRAIVRKPKVFLMDEPLSNLDAKLRVQMRIEIAKLHENLGATIIYVTHDQTEAMTLGTRIVVMKDGVVQQVDTPQNLYTKPCNLFVAGFIGSPQMNFLDAEVKVNGSDVTLSVGGHELPVPADKKQALIDKGYAGKTVILGIRPEDVHVAATFTGENAGTVHSTINVYELLGAEVFLYFDVAGTQVTARVGSGTELRSGDKASFTFDMSKIHIFDKETELTISN